MRKGKHQLKPWPFKEFNPRMVCAGSYRVKKMTQQHGVTVYDSPMTLDIEFENKKEIFWKLGKAKPMKQNKNKLMDAMLKHSSSIIEAAIDKRRKTLIMPENRPKTGTFKS
jgi:hypothetical protein